MNGLRTRRGSVFLVLSFVALALAPLPGQATEGVYLHGHGPIQRSRAGAGVASPRDATWMLLNPASIVALERRLDVGLDLVLSDLTLRPGGLLGNGFGGEMSDDQYFFVPSLGAVWPVETGAFGLGLYVPGGEGTDFPASRSMAGRLLYGNADRRGDYQHGRLVAAYGRRLGEAWAVGLSANVSLSRFRTDSLTLHLTPTRGGNDWDDALGGGFSVGFYGQWERWAVGGVYQSRQWSERFDQYGDLLRFPVDLAPIVQVGLSRRLTPALELVADYKFIDWSSVDLLGRTPRDGGLGWRDQHIAKVGIEWRAGARWTVRTGISHGNAPVTREHVFVNGLTTAGVIESHISAGLSYALDERSEFHLTYVHAPYRTLVGSSKKDLFSLLGAGTEIGAGHNGFTLGYTYRF